MEYRRESLDRPVVVAVPSALQLQQPQEGVGEGEGEGEGEGAGEGDVWQELRSLQLVPKTGSRARA